MFFAKIKSLVNNRTLKNGALFSGFSFINRGISFFLLLILANYIAPVEYGYLNLFATVVMIIGYFIAMSTEGYLSVVFFKEGIEGIKNAISCIFSTSLIVSAVLISSLLIAGDSIATLLNLPLNLLYLAIVICFFTLYSHIFLDLFRLRENVKVYGIFSCSNAILNFISSIVLVKFLSMGWEGRIYSQTFCFAAYGLIGIIFLIQKKLFVLPQKKFWKDMLIWGIPLIPHLATNFIRQGCDRYIINYNHSIEEVGLFSFALNLTNIIIMIGMGFNQSNSVEIYKVLGSKELDAKAKVQRLNHQRKQIFWVYLTLSLMVCAAAYIMIPWILPKYTKAIDYFLILAMYGFLQCVYFLFTNILFFYKRTRLIMSITFISSIIHLILSLVLTPYSLFATCAIYVLSQFLICLFIIFFSMKTLSEKVSNNG